MKAKLKKISVLFSALCTSFGMVACSSDSISIKDEVAANINTQGSYLGNMYDGTYRYEGAVTYRMSGDCPESQDSTQDPNSNSYYVITGNEITYPNRRSQIDLMNQNGNMHDVGEMDISVSGPVDQDGTLKMYSELIVVEVGMEFFQKFEGHFVEQNGTMTLHQNEVLQNCSTTSGTCCTLTSNSPLVYTRQ